MYDLTWHVEDGSLVAVVGTVGKQFQKSIRVDDVSFRNVILEKDVRNRIKPNRSFPKLRVKHTITTTI